ncbi:flavodoxin family protein [Desulfopila sp. IMCC35008]|uniref:flavodoxin family protein n=1 Tax=Desulfopila sp. IMCC35008 TaxID=2653858 RepID=UPI0013D67F34|nr:flavodoxin family protein [Desulfopila sp. IMCC35008]
MKIVSLLGSPRKKGNSTQLAGIVTSTLKEKGNSVTEYFLNELVFKGCQACMACKGKSESCVVKDDLAPVLEAVKEADVIMMATPVYWGEISAQLKSFIDRTYSYLTPGFMTEEIKHRLPKGKKLVFIQSQGAPQELYADVFERYNAFFKMLNYFDETHLLRGCELNELGQAMKRDDLVTRAKEIAEKLL